MYYKKELSSLKIAHKVKYKGDIRNFNKILKSLGIKLRNSQIKQ